MNRSSRATSPSNSHYFSRTSPDYDSVNTWGDWGRAKCRNSKGSDSSDFSNNSGGICETEGIDHEHIFASRCDN